MKRIKLVLPLVAIAVGLLLCTACKKEKEEQKSEHLPLVSDNNNDAITNIKWQLTKIGDKTNDNYEIPLPVGDNLYWLQFNQNNTIEGFGCVNTFAGTYNFMPDKTSITIQIGCRTPVNEPYGYEEKLCNIMNDSTFVIQKTGNNLLLYYNGKNNYLEFVEIQ